MSKLCYLAHPIDLGRADPESLEFVIGQLQADGVKSYDPLNAFNVTGHPDGLISRVNHAAMEASTGAVAFLPSGTQSIGVPAEIDRLLGMGRPVVIVTDLLNRSYVVAGWAENPNCHVVGMDSTSLTLGVGWLLDRMEDSTAAPTKSQTIVFGQVAEGATLPTRGYATDAGYDLYTVGDHTVQPGEFVDVPCGVSVDLPDGTWGQITGRSSTMRVRGLHVVQGVIDEEYTGPLYAGVKNMNDEPVTIAHGERVAQIILHEATGQKYVPEWGVPRQKERGSNGFGSTGR